MFAQRAGQFYLTQLLFKNDYMAGLKLTQNRLEIKNRRLEATIIIKRWTFINKQFNKCLLFSYYSLKLLLIVYLLNI